MMRLWFLLCCLSLTHFAHAEERLRLATTTSTQNSGLMDVLNPIFEKQHNVKVDVIAVGTGKALRLGEKGDVDAVLVHAPSAEKKFVAEGYGVERLPIMHNDFVILGSNNDPAGLKQAENGKAALELIAKNQAEFISRGDDSGTHKKELSLWKSAKIEPAGKWYIAAGQGMGAVITMANDKLAYTLADRGTYLAYKDKIDLVIAYAGDPILFNPYHFIMVNPERHSHIKKDLAQAYVNFLQSEQGQNLIREYKVNGEQLFHPDVIK